VADNTPPTITCPENISILCGAVVTYTAPVGTENCAGSTTTLTAGLESGATFPVGITTQTYTVTDGGGNTDSCSFTVTIEDNEPPVASCVPGPNPAGVIQPADNQDGFWTIQGTDNCPFKLSIEDAGTGMHFAGPFYDGTNVKYVQAPGTKIPKQKPGSGVVNWKLTGSGYMMVIATDAAGNTGDPVFCLLTDEEEEKQAEDEKKADSVMAGDDEEEDWEKEQKEDDDESGDDHSLRG
jgi:hypothetical protein